MSVNEHEFTLEFEKLLDYLKHMRGFDFSGYKRPSLIRRVWKRMGMVGIEHFSDYVDYLEVHPDEFVQLFNVILINVTAFFRDMPAWEFVMSELVPRIMARKPQLQPIRVWSAGCASGEEAYTLAMVLAEGLGVEAFRDRVKIYATDMDEEALATARQATYSAKEVAGIPPELRDKYFERTDSRFTFRKDMRRSVIFGRHDLIQDAPISRIDMLVCRNVLMYFNAETQARILARFNFALEEGGFLFLGRAEMLFTHSATFTPVDLRRRIFIGTGRVNMRDHLLLMNGNGETHPEPVTHPARLREKAYDSGTVAQIAVDHRGLLILANERMRQTFGISAHDIGRPLKDMEISYRPIELRSAIEQAIEEQRPVILKDVDCSTQNESRWMDVTITPLHESGGSVIGVSLAFADVTRYRRLQEELEHSHQELETAYEELQSTNEELETTNEELQSTVEELETTNEELQSTNEELETMNEELQSTNEELQTINDELRQRSDDLNQANAFLESILTSLRIGVVVLDTNLHILNWNHRSEDLWGLRAEEVSDMHFLNLDIGLPVDRLRATIRACLSGEDGANEMVLDAINRRGKAIRCRVSCTPLVGYSGETQGVIMAMEVNE